MRLVSLPLAMRGYVISSSSNNKPQSMGQDVTEISVKILETDTLQFLFFSI